MTQSSHIPAGVDTNVPTPARIYDYMLRGHNFFEPDKQAAEQILSVVPEIRDAAWSNRGFHQRAAKWIADQGVRQFIDIGSGLPTVGNTHEVVQKIIPDVRVVYVDNDPMVELHSQDILTGEESIGAILGDLREPASILDNPKVRDLIDFGQPTGLLMTGVMMFVADSSDPWDLVRRYVDALAPGSYLSLSHLTDDHKPPASAEGFRAAFDTATEHLYFRSKSEVARFFEGLEMVAPYDGAEPDLCFTGVWGAEDVALADSEGSRWLYCGVAKAAMNAKPTTDDLGIDPDALDWQRSGPGDGSIEVAFVRGSGAGAGRSGGADRSGRTGDAGGSSAPGTSADWVLMRVAGDPGGRVLVFDRNEWECFLDGARNGEFDNAAAGAGSAPNCRLKI